MNDQPILYINPDAGQLDNPSGFPVAVELADEDALYEATKGPHSLIEFGANRDAKGFKKAVGLGMDIDNDNTDIESEWTYPSDIRKNFSSFDYSLAPSKSHMKVKHKGDPKKEKSARPRFHVFFHVNNPIREGEKFVRLLETLAVRFDFMNWDPKVIVPSQFFYGHGGKAPKEAFAINRTGKPITSILGGRQPAKKTDVDQGDMSVRELLEYPEAITDRHGAFLRISIYLAIQQYDAEDIVKKLEEVNKRLADPKSGSVFEKEIKGTASWAIDKYNQGVFGELFDKVRNFRVVKDGAKFKKVLASDATKEMKETRKFFMVLQDGVGSRQMALREMPDRIINTQGNLNWGLRRNGYGMELIPSTKLNPDAVLADYQNEVQTYTRITTVPEIHQDPNTFLYGVGVWPGPRKTGALLELLNLYTFASEVDRYRFAAFLLSGFLGREFDGAVPLCAVRAPGPNAGKSTVVRHATKAIMGMSPIEQGENQQQDTAQFSGLRGQACTFVLYDNLAEMLHAEERALNATLTDENRSAWNFGKSRSRIPNSYRYAASINDDQGFGHELSERTIVVRMKDAEEITDEDRTKISRKLNKFSRERTEDLRADIRYYAEFMKDEKHSSSVKPLSKMSLFCDVVGRALGQLFPDVEEFDLHPGSQDRKMDKSSDIVAEFFLKMIGDRFIPKDKDDTFYHIAPATDLFENFSVIFPAEARRMGDSAKFGTALGMAKKNLPFGKLVRTEGRRKRWEFTCRLDEVEEYAGISYKKMGSPISAG